MNTAPRAEKGEGKYKRSQSPSFILFSEYCDYGPSRPPAAFAAVRVALGRVSLPRGHRSRLVDERLPRCRGVLRLCSCRLKHGRLIPAVNILWYYGLLWEF